MNKTSKETKIYYDFDTSNYSNDLVTICISHYNRLKKLKKTIKKIYTYTPDVFRIRIFNDGYINQEIDNYLSDIEKKSEVRVIRSEKNIGPVASRYHLLKNIDTPLVLILDDDMYVDKNWLKDGIKVFNIDDDIGIIGFPFKSTTSEDVANTRKIEIRNDVLFTYEKNIDVCVEDFKYIEVDEVATGAMLIKTPTLQDFQFDCSYKLGFGDIDKTLQILNSSWKQVILQNHCFTHDKHVDSSEYQKSGDYGKISYSYNHFINKWNIRYPFKQHIKFKYLYPIYNRILG